MGCFHGNSRKCKRNRMTVCLHILLWSSICTLAVAVDLFVAASDDSLLCSSASFTLASSSITIVYIILHNVISRQRILEDEQATVTINASKVMYFAIRLAAITTFSWLITVGWNVLVAARQPLCIWSDRIALQSWATGGQCVAQRSGTVLSMIALIASCTLFGYINANLHAFDSHLFGSIKGVNSAAKTIRIGTRREKEASQISHRESINSSVSQPMQESGISSCHLSRVNSTASNQVTAIGLGIYTPAGSIYGSPPSSRPGTALSNRIYQQRNVSASSLSLKGFNPPPNFLTPTRPTPAALLPGSVYKAIYPPSHPFRHSPSPLRPAISIRAIPPSPFIGVRRTPTGHFRTSTFTSLPTIPADSQPAWLQTTSDMTEATSGSTLSISTHSSISASATGSTESSISKVKHKRCSSDVTIPSTLAERRESGGSNLTERLDKEIEQLTKRRVKLATFDRLFHSSHTLQLELPEPLFTKRECSESSSLGYCAAGELGIDRFPRRIDSLDNMRASPV